MLALPFAFLAKAAALLCSRLSAAFSFVDKAATCIRYIGSYEKM